MQRAYYNMVIIVYICILFQPIITMAHDQPYTPHALAEAFGRGEEKAFDYLFRAYYGALCLFAGNYLEIPDDARDLVQDCFVKLWSRRTALKNPQAIRSFLYTTVRNACLNVLRSKNRISLRDPLEPAGFRDPLEDKWLEKVVEAETLREIYVHVQSLPPRTREVFLKFYLEGKDCNAIALDLHRSPSTVRNQKNKALTILREKFQIFMGFMIFFL
jgi:RNA polymerase sigma-70 factor (family 1)